jgi:NDP-sugar pyrophosphorylase family protein
MTVIITMAGAGNRFRSLGYTVSKHMIFANGKTLFEWSMESLKLFYNQLFIFATLFEHDAEWITETAERMGIFNSKIISRPLLSRGQAETAFDVLGSVTDNEPLWIFNIDTYIEYGLSPADLLGYDGCVPVFYSDEPGLSYVRKDTSGRVFELAEKKVISQFATVGMYGFSSASLYRDLYHKGYECGFLPLVSGERYVAPLYQLLLTTGSSVIAPQINNAAVHVLGTPAQIVSFDPLVVPPKGSR